MRHTAAERCVYGSNAKILPALFRSIANQYKYVCIDKECEKSHWNLAPFVNIYIIVMAMLMLYVPKYM